MKSNQPNEFYEFGEFRLDAKKCRLWKNGDLVALTPKEFEVLFALVKCAGSVLEKDELLDAVWKEIYVEEATLTRNISFLRKKLGRENLIETLPKRGYRFLPAVRKIENAPPLVIEEQILTSISIEETLSLSDTETRRHGDAAKNRQVLTDISASPRLPVSASPRPRVLALLLIVFGSIAAIGFAVYQVFLKKNEPKTILVSRVVPFSGFVGRETMPAFSPDGKQIAFAWNGGDGDNVDVYVKLVGAGEPVRLTSNPADEIHPAFSHDGRFVAFPRSFPTRTEVFIVPALGGTERRVTTIDSIWTGISFSPDGKNLAVIDADAENKQPGVFLVEVGTGAKRRLTSPPEFAGDNTPRFSPDGASVAFVRSFGMITQDIFVISATGGEERQLTFDKSDIRGANWSSSGEQIVFASYRINNQSNLWQIALDGGEPELIVTGGKNVVNPAVSPDGRSLAFVEEANDTNIWRIAGCGLRIADCGIEKTNSGQIDEGRGQKTEDRKTNAQSAIRDTQSTKLIASSRADHSPNFTPDGDRLVFVSDRTGKYEIWIADADGTNQRQLTDSPDAVGSPRFSPDGRFIAFDGFAGGNGDIFIVSTDGGQPRRLTEADSHDVLPTWSADGRSIYFTSNRGGSLNIWKIATDIAGDAKQITRQGAFESFAAPDGTEVFYTRARGVTGIWRVPAEGGEETSLPKLSAAGYWRYWTVTPGGIYFVPRSPSGPFKIKFYDFASERIDEISTTAQQPIWIFSGLSASADGATILYSQYDHIASSIMLAEIK